MKYIYLCIVIALLNCKASGQEIVPANGTSGLDVGYHQIIEKAKLCAGIDLNKPYTFKKSAFIYSIDKNVKYNPEIKVKAYLVKGRSEIHKLLNYDTKIEVSIPFIGGGGGEIHAGVDTNNIDDEVSLVFLATSIYNPEIPDDNDIILTAEAETLKTEPLKFKKKYGLYFYNAIFKGHRLVCSVNLRKSSASANFNLFASGNASIGLDEIGIEAQTSIRGEIKKTVSDNSSSLTIDAYGGPDIKEYKGALTSMIQGDSTIQNISIYLETLLSNFNYENAKPLKAYLSDYSAWGIEDSPLLNDAVFGTQKALLNLYPKVTSQINTLKILSSDSKLKNEFSDDQLKTAKINIIKLMKLRADIEKAHEQLNNGDIAFVGKDVVFFDEYYEIIKDNPEIYEFLMGYKNKDPLSFLYDYDYNMNFVNIKTLINQVSFYNTFNSKSAFSNIKRVLLVNTETNMVIEQIDLAGSSSGSLSLSESNIQSLNLSALISPSRLEIFTQSLHKDISNFFQIVINQNNQGPSIYTRYEISLIDNFDRVYKFPFIDANISFDPWNNVFARSLKQLGTNEICIYLPDYNTTDLDKLKLPQSIFIDMSQIVYKGTKNLVLKIRTNNNLINNNLEESKNWDFNMKIGDLKANSGLYIDLSNYSFKSFDKLDFNWYTINDQGVNSETKQKEITLHRSLCNSTVKLY